MTTTKSKSGFTKPRVAEPDTIKEELANIPDPPPPDPIPWSECPPEKPRPIVSAKAHQDYYLDWCAKNGVEPEKDNMIVRVKVKKPTHED